MNKSAFIEVHERKQPMYVNVNHIEWIGKGDSGKAWIYFAFTPPGCEEQDYIETDESYDDVVGMIKGAVSGARNEA